MTCYSSPPLVLHGLGFLLLFALLICFYCYFFVVGPFLIFFFFLIDKRLPLYNT